MPFFEFGVDAAAAVENGERGTTVKGDSQIWSRCSHEIDLRSIPPRDTPSATGRIFLGHFRDFPSELERGFGIGSVCVCVCVDM